MCHHTSVGPFRGQALQAVKEHGKERRARQAVAEQGMLPWRHGQARVAVGGAKLEEFGA